MKKDSDVVDLVREVALAYCVGQICSHRAPHNRPCEFHVQEAKWALKQLNKAGLEVTRTV